jgi:hypothetical protein
MKIIITIVGLIIFTNPSYAGLNNRLNSIISSISQWVSGDNVSPVKPESYIGSRNLMVEDSLKH